MKKRVLLTALLVLILVASCAVASAVYYHVSGTSWVKLRQLPYTDAKILANYRQDYALTVSKKYGDWSYVKFTDGHEGYVMSKYLKSTASYKAWITADKTALRSGPATSFASKTTLSKGLKVTVLSHGTAWDYVSTTAGSGYVRNSYLSKKYVAPTKKTGGYTAYVTNSNTSTVNVRKGAGKGYTVIGKLKVGTAVKVLSHGKTWDEIEYKNGVGYMMTQYLSRKKPGPTPSPAPTFAPTPKPTAFVQYTAYVTSPNGKSVNFRNGPGTGYANIKQLKVGSKVTVLKHANGTWDYIQYGSQKGYIMHKYLSRTVVTPTPAPSTKPTAKPTASPTPFAPYTAYVTSEDGRTVNLRTGPGTGYGTVKALGVGTRVNVIGSADGGWRKIKVSGVTGYIMNKYLSRSLVTPTPKPTSKPTPISKTYTGYIVSTNGEDVNVRKGPGTAYTHLTRLPIGTAVKVLSTKDGWCYIQYQSIKGYVKKEFISKTAP